MKDTITPYNVSKADYIYFEDCLLLQKPHCTKWRMQLYMNIYRCICIFCSVMLVYVFSLL